MNQSSNQMVNYCPNGVNYCQNGHNYCPNSVLQTTQKVSKHAQAAPDTSNQTVNYFPNGASDTLKGKSSPFLSVNDAADYLQCSRRTVQRYCEIGLLSYVRLVRKILVTRASIAHLIGSPINRSTKAGSADAIAHRPSSKAADNAADDVKGGERDE